MLIIGFDLYLTEPGKYKGIKGVGKIPIDKLNKLMDEIDRTPNRAKRLFDPNESEIVKVGGNCEIWCKLWNLVEILKFGGNCEI